MAECLMDHLGAGQGWRPGLWRQLFLAVELVGDDAREAGPYAVLIYQRFIVIAHVYLVRFPDPAKRRQLVTRINRDLESIEYHRNLMDVRAFDVHEMVLLEAAVNEIQKALTLIDR